jgi:hypothetical protein
MSSSSSSTIENESIGKDNEVESKKAYYSKLRRSNRKQLSRKEPLDFKYPSKGKIAKSPANKITFPKPSTINEASITAKTKGQPIAPKFSDDKIKTIAEIIGPECKGLNKEEILSALMLMQLVKEPNSEPNS